MAATRKCLLITRKIMIPPPVSRDPSDIPPYFMEKTFPPDCWDPSDGPPYFAKKTFPPDCWDPPATSSHARKCVHITGKKMMLPTGCWDPPSITMHVRKCLLILPYSRDPPGRSVRSVVILVANVYVHTGRCRGAHVACTCTYIGQCARKKIRPHTYIRAGSRTPTRAYVRPGLVYMAG